MPLHRHSKYAYVESCENNVFFMYAFSDCLPCSEAELIRAYCSSDFGKKLHLTKFWGAVFYSLFMDIQNSFMR